MIKKYRESTTFKYYFWITITYIITHWFLLVATGRWWDDWVYADKNWDYLYEVMRESSLPLSAIVDAINWVFPDGFYRVLVFFWYYLSTFLFYKLINKIEFFEQEDCFWVTLLFVTAPVFDARILWIMYPYAIGLPLLLGGFILAIKKEGISKKRKVERRIRSLLFLIFAYSFLQSAMLLVIPMILYLCYLELHEKWEWKNYSENVKKIVLALAHYIDYLIEPILWYVGDKLLFPGYGVYGGVYYVKWETLISTILRSPINAFITLKSILYNYLIVLQESRVVLLGIVFIVSYIVIQFVKSRMKKNNSIYDNKCILENSLMMVLGIFVFFLAFFPYCVKRNSALGVTYLSGRDTVLLGIGLSLLLYYGINILVRKEIIKLVIVELILLGTIHFNFMYLDWQESYYQQLQLQREFASNESVKNNDTFLVIYNGALISDRFYQTNGNSWTVNGDETRLFMSGTRDLYMIATDTDETRWFLNAYMMNEYEYGDRVIDGIIFVNYIDIGRGTVLKQKWNEIFNKDEFSKWIDEISDITYVSLTREESDDLISLYNSGVLDNKKVKEMYNVE